MQSECDFSVIEGNGGLPHQANDDQAREHLLAETFDWFDKYVKGATQRESLAGRGEDGDDIASGSTATSHRGMAPSSPRPAYAAPLANPTSSP